VHAFVDDPVKTPLKEQTSSSAPNAAAKAGPVAPAVIDMSARGIAQRRKERRQRACGVGAREARCRRAATAEKKASP